LFAGCVGGIAQVISGQPFDTVKVRLQTQSQEYNGTMDVVKRIIQKEGVSGFYKGTLTPLLGVGACVSVQFAALENMKRFLKGGSDQDLSLGKLFVAGASSGIANSVLSGPIEHVRTRLQVQTDSTGYKGPLDFAKKVYSDYGIRGIYKGQMITVLREICGYGIYFATYEGLMQRAMKLENKKRSEIEAWKQCSFGALSGYMLWIIIYPIDVIKSKIQTDSFGKPQFKSSIDCLRQTIAKQGVSGLYKGFAPCMLRAGPANAATFVAYEMTMNWIGR
jgi:solute carrier family 25 carnitine/acylcarnitine transporter 20/29